MVEMAVQKDGSYTMGFAGDTFNTAWYAQQLARDDIEVAYLTVVGDDSASRKMVDFISASGITPEIGTEHGRSVGLYMIALNNGEREFTYWRDASAARKLAGYLRPVDAARDDTMIVFSGITLAILEEADRGHFLNALRAARARGAQIAFDPNYRPRLWTTEQTARHWIMQAAALADYVLPSFDDEKRLFGDKDPLACAQRYVAAGVSVVAIKNGADPVLVWQDATSVSVAAQTPEEIIDTTAAGDSFNAAFLVGVLAGEPLVQAAQHGCKLAAQVVSRRGALIPVRFQH